MKTSKGARAGFTLIELLVVVVIIGILASVALPQMSNAQDRARNSSVISSTRSVFLGMESWKADYPGRLPIDLVKPGGNNPAGWPNVAGIDGDNYLAADTSANTSNFPGKYVPGGMLPRSPWGNNSQSAMDGSYNNAALQTNPQIGTLVANGQPLPISNGFFADGGGVGTGKPSGNGPLNSRDCYGYMYYVGDIGSSRYAIFGVGKAKNDAKVFAVKSNYQ